MFDLFSRQVLDLASMLLGGFHMILFPALYLALFGENALKKTDNILPCVNSKNILQTQPIMPGVIFLIAVSNP